MATLATAFSTSLGITFLVNRFVGTMFGLTVTLIAALVLGLVGARRIPTAWWGLLGWATVCAAATAAALDLGNSNRHNVTFAFGATALIGLAMVSLWMWRTSRLAASPVAVYRQAGRALVTPTSGLIPAAAGAWMALPLLGTYGPHVADPDSSWLVASGYHVRNDGVQLLQDTQEVLLPYLTVNPLIWLGGIRAAVLFMIMVLIGLAAMTGYLGWKVSGHGLGAFAATGALLTIPVVPDRANYLPMYAASLLIAYGSAWLLHNAMSNPESPTWIPIAAGAGITLSYEAQGTGQVFLVVPFLLLLLHPWRQARRPLGIALAAIAITSIPRLIINLSVDGLTALRSNRADFIVQQGYLNIINRDFHKQTVNTSPLDYLSNLPRMADDAFGGIGLILFLSALVLVAARGAGKRTTLFCCAAGTLFLVMLLVSSPAPYERYLTPITVGVALVVAAGAVRLLREGGSPTTLGYAVVVTLVVAAFAQMTTTVDRKAAEHAALTHGPLPTLASLVDDDRSVLGTRSHELAQVNPDIGVLFQRMMSEEDFVTFLSWPNDQEVIEMMERLNAGWLLVRNDPVREVRYHETWLRPVHGLTADWVLKVADSDRFCLVEEAPGYWLYRLGDCRPGDAGTEGLGTATDPALDAFRIEAGLPALESDEAVPHDSDSYTNDEAL